MPPSESHTRAAPAARPSWSWVRQYAPLELAGWFGSLTAAWAALSLTTRLDVFVLAAVVGELTCFYGAAILRELVRDARASRRRGARSILGRLMGEFALAEALDALLVRPLALAAMSALGAPPMQAVLLGSTLADLCFYSLAAASVRRLASVGTR